MNSQLQKLFERRQSGGKFSLDPIRRLCSALGNPEKDLKFIHIAGTNGKGSVAAMCAAILRESGISTGLYTSPHLIRYHERFRLNGREITDKDLDDLLETVMSQAGDATFFEISTALALCWFQKKRAEIVVWETGLGGRLDATNIVTPLVSVIASIGLDHTQWLGNTLAEVAGEKAGIIKPRIPVVTVRQSAEIMNVIESVAEKQKSSLQVIEEKDLNEFDSPLAGEHQRWNTALAVAAARVASSSLTPEKIRSGLKKTVWPGRCQEVKRKGLPSVLIDGAHNPMGMKVLVDEVKRRWGNGKTTFIFGALADKKISDIAEIIGNVPAEIFLTPVVSERSASTKELLTYLSDAKSFSSLSEALTAAGRKGRPIVITGSLFLVGEALSLLTGKECVLHPNEKLLI